MKPPEGCAGALTERVTEVDLTLPGVEARSCDDDEAAKRRAIAKAVRAEAAWSSCVAITIDDCCRVGWRSWEAITTDELGLE
jgi:hypothetical protein